MRRPYAIEESDDGGAWRWQGSSASDAAEARAKVGSRRLDLTAMGAKGVRVRARQLRPGEA